MASGPLLNRHRRWPEGAAWLGRDARLPRGRWTPRAVDLLLTWAHRRAGVEYRVARAVGDGQSHAEWLVRDWFASEDDDAPSELLAGAHGLDAPDRPQLLTGMLRDDGVEGELDR